MAISETRAAGKRYASPSERLRPVQVWLYVIAALVLLMVVVGGATRLTESGLSITEWKPVTGILPPLTEADWQVEFEAYQRIPQYQLINHWMSLDDFKYIYWWEWAHRFLGRVLGLAFAIPFAVFLVQRRFSWDLAVPLGGIFLLGALQGVIGWWMVTSGLTQLTSVSQYRLASHLVAAAILLVAIIWVARRLIRSSVARPDHTARGPVAGLLALVLVQIAAGAFVAGLNAGLIYNTWPLMDGGLIPQGLVVAELGWRSLFEAQLTVQFVHRMIAYGIVVYAAWLLLRQARAGGFGGAHAWLPRIALLIVVQMVLGIWTLLALVPLPLALGHQALAFMLLGAITAYLADLTPTRARQSLYT